MYLMSTEPLVRLGERKDKSMSLSAVGGSASAALQCQKCFQTGHWTYECKKERFYISRPSRTQQLNNPTLRMKPSIDDLDGNDDDEGLLDVENGKERGERRSKKCKRKHQWKSDSGSDSEASVFETDRGSSESSEGSSSKYSSSSDSEEEQRRRRKARKSKKKQKEWKERRGRRYSSSESESSESESVSDSDYDEDRSSRKIKSKRHNNKRR